jgi:hypothetical protein
VTQHISPDSPEIKSNSVPTWFEGVTAANAALHRGATKAEIMALCHGATKVSETPQEHRPAVLEAFAALGLPTDAMQRIRHLLEKYENQSGKFVIYGVNPEGGPPHIEHVVAPGGNDISRRHCLEKLAKAYRPSPRRGSTPRSTVS